MITVLGYNITKSFNESGMSVVDVIIILILIVYAIGVVQWVQKSVKLSRKRLSYMLIF